MPRRQTVLLLVVAGAAILALGVSCLWCSPRPAPVVTSPPANASSPADQPAPVPAKPALPPTAAPTTARSAPPPAPPVATTRSARDAGRPQCVRDLDCKGPRQADCTRPTCVDGRCVYDYSRCECRSNEDCDDGDPCTRNHCFVATMKCVYIKDACRD